jgi:hypothetical protein
MSTQRRSQRANKGQHTKRSFDEIYSDDVQTNHKVAKTEDGDYNHQMSADDVNDENINDDGDSVVRCTPCGLTDANYDEATDTGGTMIQCDNCNSWLHAKCMGFKSDKAIPDHFECNICNAEEFDARTKAKKVQKTPKTQKPLVEKTDFAALKESHRISTAKAFANFFQTSFPETYTFPPDHDKESLAKKWAIEIESIIHNDFPKANYNSESRRILFLLKKRFIGDLIDGNLTFQELAKKTPEEINQTIKQVKQKLKQDIKNIVLVQDDEHQIIRRTHKGEEVRESYDDQHEGIDESITIKSVDHRRFSEQDEVILPVKVNTKPTTPTQRTYFHSDDEDEEADFEDHHLQETNLNHQDIGNDVETESSELDHVNEPTDDDALMKFTGQKKTENTIGPQVWQGRISFPEYATFQATGKFYSSTPSTEGDHSIDTSIQVSKEILSRSSYDVEGRLDREKADKYLNVIIASRDLFLIKITGDDSDYQKLYDYLLIRNKVGVLSGKPYFVKDAYLIPIDFRDEKLPLYLVKHKMDHQIGLFALYVVKKDFKPTSFDTDPYEPSEEPSSTLSAIMSQLE